MTFSTELTRHLFHELPTDEQVRITRLEQHVAEAGFLLHVESVMTFEGSLNVVVRIAGKLNVQAPIGSS